MQAVGAAAGVYSFFARDLPDASAIETEQVEFETVRIFDRTGQHLLYESFDPRPFRGDRTYLPLEEMNPWVISATVGLEDRSFWDNPGVNPIGLGRAFVSNLRGGDVQGGSSITQQLIKNIIIDPEERYQRSYTRKFKEVIMAMEITRRPPLSTVWDFEPFDAIALAIFVFGISDAFINAPLKIGVILSNHTAHIGHIVPINDTHIVIIGTTDSGTIHQ